MVLCLCLDIVGGVDVVDVVFIGIGGLFVFNLIIGRVVKLVLEFVVKDVNDVKIFEKL